MWFGTSEEQTRRSVMDAGIRKINLFYSYGYSSGNSVLLDVIDQAKGTPVHYGRLAKLAGNHARKR